MFGMPEQFPYVQCDDCKCLQIESIPGDIARYYPDNYYSFCPKPGKRDFVKTLGSRLLMSPVASLWPDTKMKRIHSWMKEAGVTYSSRILDVGCGSGGLLCQLACCGFRRLNGVDSHAWNHYREHWFQLDAPRHFYLHSLRSMQILCEKSDLRIDRVVYDSRESQFWASEQ